MPETLLLIDFIGLVQDSVSLLKNAPKCNNILCVIKNNSPT